METTSPRAVLAPLWESLRPPARLDLNAWAEAHFYLSAESAAEPGRWRSIPYQIGIMNAITDPQTERVTFMKSARVGATKIMDATVGYYMHQDPCAIMVVQPTVEDAQGYSKEEIAPMLRDCPVLADLVASKSRTSESTILAKSFPGGSLTMVGANSARGFRRVSRRVVIFDEVDGYPPSAGNEGDQIKLGIRRTEFFWNRKIIAASTPTVAGYSRIERMFEEGDQRRFFVPCPHCGAFDILTFREDADRGHFMRWPDGKPEAASFVCRTCGSEIDERHKLAILADGEWRADAEFSGHASFHIWAAYSVSPNSRWGQIAAEFVEAAGQGVEQLKTVVNTVLGETWQDRGEAPDWSRIFERREPYPIGTVPDGAAFLTAGVDVQRDRFVFEIVAWAPNKESWSVDSGLLFGDTADGKTWLLLDDLLSRTYAGKGGPVPVSLLAIDSGYNTQAVYNWARRFPMNRVVACKGSATARVLVGTPSPVDVAIGGRARRRAYKVWPVGVNLAKSELYGFLRLPPPDDGDEPAPGYCHFPEYDQEFFRQLTAEHLVTTKRRDGFARHEWQILPGRENHFLDCRVYARAAASVLGLDRVIQRPASAPAQSKPKPKKKKPRQSWLSKRRR